jgi:hypothetical protein
MIRLSHKPVRKCHGCPLNLRTHCWGYSNPRAQWQRRLGCSAFANTRIHHLYELWRKQAAIKTRREIRRECIHHRPPERIYYLEKGRAARLTDFPLSLSPD